MAVTDPEVLARQAAIRANISKLTGAQFDATGGVTKVADSYNEIGKKQPTTVQGSIVSEPTTTTAAPPQGFQSTYTGPDIAGMEGKLNSAIELRKAAELDAIRRERETALQGYNKMETQTKQQAYDNRNSADVTNMQNAQRMRQAMADMGLSISGDNITEISRGNAQRQGAIGSINRDESNVLTDIGERRNLTINQAAGAERSLVANLEAERLRNSVDFMKYGDTASREWDNTQFGRFDSNRNFDQRTEEIAWNRSPDNPAVQSQLISNKINQIKLDNLPEETRLGLEGLKQDLATGKLNYQEAELKLKELQDPNSLTNRALKADVTIKELEAKYLPQEKQLALTEIKKRIANIGKTRAVTPQEQRMKEIALEKAEIELANLKDGKPDKADSFNLDDYESHVNRSFYHTDPTSGVTSFDAAGARNYIISLNLPDSETDEMLKMYGMPTN